MAITDQLIEQAFSDLSLLVSDGNIVEKGANKYAYVQRARYLLWALLCQAILNDPKIDERAEAFGRRLRLEAQYTDWLLSKGV